MSSRISTDQISVGIKSFLRPESLERVLESVRPLGYKAILVADDGAISPEKEDLYRRAQETIPGFRLLRLPFDVGVSAGRNALVAVCETEFLQLLDDDHALPENVVVLGDVLAENPGIGGVSGYLSNHGDVRRTDRDLLRLGTKILRYWSSGRIRNTASGIAWVGAEYIPFATLYRVACLRDSAWDEQFRIGSEHSDFYLAHKRLGRWTFAVVPQVVFGHFPHKSGEYATAFRHNADRLLESRTALKAKWGITDIKTFGRKGSVPVRWLRRTVDRLGLSRLLAA